MPTKKNTGKKIIKHQTMRSEIQLFRNGVAFLTAYRVEEFATRALDNEVCTSVTQRVVPILFILVEKKNIKNVSFKRVYKLSDCVIEKK